MNDNDTTTKGEDAGSKRQKRDILQVDITNSNSETLSYYHADPFPHVIIPNVFTEEFLSTVIRAIKDHSTVDFKESDLFKVFQSMDLSPSSSSSNELPPPVQQLRDTFYSAPWRQWIAQQCRLPVATCTTTSSTTTTTAKSTTTPPAQHVLAATPLDCAVNAHAHGCHLLCHDDAMRTRRVSFVLYLTDPDWSVATDGGGLELYDSTCSSSIPCRTLTPTRNQLVVFPVTPGVSLHAVQEVRRTVSPRLAVQGWYHHPPTTTHHGDGDTTQEDGRKGTLQELKELPPTEANDVNNYTPLDGLDDDKDDATTTCTTTGEDTATSQPERRRFALTDADRTLLQQWINPTYLSENSMQELRERFDADSAIQLHSFLRPDKAFVVPSEDDDDTDPSDYTYGVTKATTTTTNEEDTSSAWRTVGPPHKQRYLEYTTTSKQQDSITTQNQHQHPLATIGNELLRTPSFAKYLYALTSLPVRGWHTAHTRRFRRGRDYTVAHHGQLLDYSVLDATLCFVHTNTELWAGGDVGGYDCYTAAVLDGDDSPDDTYVGDNDGDDAKDELLNVPAAHNTLSLVYRDPGTMRFIKYVSAAAPSSRWDIAMEYSVPPDDDDENKVHGENDDDEKVVEEGTNEVDEGPVEEGEDIDAEITDQNDAMDEGETGPAVGANEAE